MTTIELQKSIVEVLIKCTPKVFYESADQEADFPYIVYDFIGEIPDYESQKDKILLEIDCWSNKTDSREVESIADAVIGNRNRLNTSGLDQLLVTNNNFSARFYLDNKQNIPDPSPDIRRRKLTFEIQIFYIN
jgi:hypothetical protein